MKFNDSPVIDLPVTAPTGNIVTLSFQQDNNSIHVGTSVWPCSLLLVKFIEQTLNPSNQNPNPNYTSLFRNLPSKRAIELGSGCGVAGMGLMLLGLSDILLTDISPVLPALKHNVKRNRDKFAKSPKYQQLYWNNVEQIRKVAPPFDFVVATDVVYMEDSALWLVDALDALVGESGVVLLGYQLRSPEAHALFWEKVAKVFKAIEKVKKEDLHPEYAYEEADVYIMRKRN